MRFDAKDPEEVIVLSFGFARLLAPGATLSAPVVSVLVKDGADPAPGSLIDGLATVDGSNVLQKVRAGVAGTVYALRCKAQTSDGQTLVLAADLPVRNAQEG